MFLRIVADSFGRRPRHKLLTGAALALGMGVATAALSVSLDVGDRLAKEFRSLGANLLVTPQADSLPLEIGGVDYRPVNVGAYLPEADLAKLKTIFWHNNIIAFAPVLEDRASLFVEVPSADLNSLRSYVALHPAEPEPVPIIGTWAQHKVSLSDGSSFVTGIDKTSPWWQVQGRWFIEGSRECVVGPAPAQRMGCHIGDHIYLGGSGPRVILQSSLPQFLVTGLLTTGSSEDDAIILPLDATQHLSERPGQYRRLFVSALTKPEDDFARRDPKTMNAGEFEQAGIAWGRCASGSPCGGRGRADSYAGAHAAVAGHGSGAAGGGACCRCVFGGFGDRAAYGNRFDESARRRVRHGGLPACGRTTFARVRGRGRRLRNRD